MLKLRRPQSRIYLSLHSRNWGRATRRYMSPAVERNPSTSLSHRDTWHTRMDQATYCVSGNENAWMEIIPHRKSIFSARCRQISSRMTMQTPPVLCSQDAERERTPRGERRDDNTACIIFGYAHTDARIPAYTYTKMSSLPTNRGSVPLSGVDAQRIHSNATITDQAQEQPAAYPLEDKLKITYDMKLGRFEEGCSLRQVMSCR